MQCSVVSYHIDILSIFGSIHIIALKCRLITLLTNRDETAEHMKKIPNTRGCMRFECKPTHTKTEQQH